MLKEMDKSSWYKTDRKESMTNNTIISNIHSLFLHQLNSQFLAGTWLPQMKTAFFNIHFLQLGVTCD